DSNFNLVGELDNYTSYEISRKWGLAGSFRLIAPFNDTNKEFLQADNIIFTELNKGYIISSVQYVEGANEKLIQCLGKSLDGILDRRITVADTYAAQPKETIIKGLIDTNIISATDTDRNISILGLGADLARGTNIDFVTDRKNLLAEIETICINKDISLTTEIDLSNKKILIDVTEGLDRTYGNGVNPQAIFSREFDNLKSSSYTRSNINKVNVAYVGSTEVGTATGIDRFEGVTAAGELSEQQTGEIYIAERKGETSIECEVVTTSNLVYGVDYDLGDIVTIKNTDWGVSVDTRIIEVSEIYEAGNIRIDIIFGEKGLSLTDIIKKNN
ncbi:MAG: hypothetical protein EOL95_12030, partial [Bacteroidia bacterium]|nr:hypothetical protein [Bacteroidia bacterium]